MLSFLVRTFIGLVIMKGCCYFDSRIVKLKFFLVFFNLQIIVVSSSPYFGLSYKLHCLITSGVLHYYLLHSLEYYLQYLQSPLMHQMPEIFWMYPSISVCIYLCPKQFFSLSQSPVDGKPMLLTPEQSIKIQVGIFFTIYNHGTRDLLVV